MLIGPKGRRTHLCEPGPWPLGDGDSGCGIAGTVAIGDRGSGGVYSWDSAEGLGEQVRVLWFYRRRMLRFCELSWRECRGKRKSLKQKNGNMRRRWGCFGGKGRWAHPSTGKMVVIQLIVEELLLRLWVPCGHVMPKSVVVWGKVCRMLLGVVVVDSHIQRIVLATEETTVTQQVSHRPIKRQSRLWSQRGTKVNGSHHGDNPLLRPTGIQIATKSYAALQAMAPTNIKTVHQTSLLHSRATSIDSECCRLPTTSVLSKKPEKLRSNQF